MKNNTRDSCLAFDIHLNSINPNLSLTSKEIILKEREHLSHRINQLVTIPIPIIPSPKESSMKFRKKKEKEREGEKEIGECRDLWRST